jgi:hypothetical protein
MPWYWSDDIARVLVVSGKLDNSVATAMISAPVAYRSEASTIESAIDTLLDDDEIPLAA